MHSSWSLLPTPLHSANTHRTCPPFAIATESHLCCSSTSLPGKGCTHLILPAVIVTFNNIASHHVTSGIINDDLSPPDEFENDPTGHRLQALGPAHQYQPRRHPHASRDNPVAQVVSHPASGYPTLCTLDRVARGFTHLSTPNTTLPRIASTSCCLSLLHITHRLKPSAIP